MDTHLGNSAAESGPSTSKPSPVTLCPRCQPWNDTEAHNIGFEYRYTKNRSYVSLDQLQRNGYCAMCTALLGAYHARCAQDPQLQSWPPPPVTLEVSGPFYLDNGFGEKGAWIPRWPGSTLESGCDIVKTFLEVTIKGRDSGPFALNDNGEESLVIENKHGHVEPIDEVRLAPTLLIMTPLFRMVHSTTTKPFLCRIEDWEVPYFNIDLIKGWMKRCDIDHGKQCMGLVNNDGKYATIRRDCAF